MRWRFVRIAATLSIILAAVGVAAVQTVPELVLYGERSRLNLLDFEAKVSLKPIDLPTSDGIKVRSWYHAPMEGKPTIVYFPDRLGDIIHKPAHLYTFTEQGYGLMLVGYRGYGGNPGYPSETLLYADSMALLKNVEENDLAPDGMIVYGYSMGTGVASYIASQVRPLALILEAPFTSFGDAVRQQATQVPQWLVRTKFDTRSRIGGIDVPILLLAGGKDWVTPPAFAESLAALNQNSSLHVLPQANHLNLIRLGGGTLVQTFLDGIKTTVPGVEMADLTIPGAGTVKVPAIR